MNDDFFDHDHNGKLDAFESVMKYDMTEQMLRDEPSAGDDGFSPSRRNSSNFKGPALSFWAWLAIIIAGYAAIFLFAGLLDRIS